MRSLPGQAPGVLEPRRSATGGRRAGAIGNGVGVERLPAAPARRALARRRASRWRRRGGTASCCSTQHQFRLEGEAARALPVTPSAVSATRSATAQEPRAPPASIRTPTRGDARLGHGDRHHALHRLQRLRRRLPGGEQRAGRRPGGDRARPRHALAAHRHLRHRADGRAAARLPAGALHALRDGALRAGLPGRGLGARPRGAERPGLQPLHRHALLRGQLPLQGAPLQLLRLCRRPGLRQPRRRVAARRSTIPTSRCAAAA